MCVIDVCIVNYVLLLVDLHSHYAKGEHYIHCCECCGFLHVHVLTMQLC